MSRPDLVLLHPPSVYDFRQKTILYGPISDLIPSSPIFEMYPIGFASIAEYLERFGYRVRIINLAVHMLNDPKFDTEKMIKRLKSLVFGIDLHWLVHAHGAIEIARLVKKYHPKAKLVMGGLSASYYYRELLEYPEIDFVLRGDSTEEPFRLLMNCLKNGSEPATVPNLAWRDTQGRLQETPLSYVPTDFGGSMVRHYDNIIRSVIRYHDLASYIPFKRWLSYPITAVLTCRGCTQNCIFCGGSAAAFRSCYNRSQPAFRSPTEVAQDVKRIKRFTSGPIFILGDIRQPGADYAEQLLGLLKEEGVKNRVILELFYPASKEFLARMGDDCPGFCLEMSPESHDPTVRDAIGKHYSNEVLEETIGYALAAGSQRLDIFFMIGLPKQTQKSVMDTIDYCGYLLDKFKSDKRLFPFISPLAPFLDPGSLAFEHPERYGYRLLFRSLEEHRQALLAPSWKYMLNYETEWMNRNQIVAIAYDASLRLNRLKAKHGLISNEVAQAIEHRIQVATEIVHRIDDIIACGDYADRGEELSRLKATVDEVNMPTICGKTELELPTPFIKLRPLQALWSLVTGR